MIAGMSNSALAERRSSPRFPSDGLLVSVRRKGRLGRIDGMAQDFNRHGVAFVITQSLPKDTTVYVTLQNDTRRVDNIVGVVHNCTLLGKSYRCGIQFRTCSELQLDQEATEGELAAMEAHFNRHRGPGTKA